MAVIPASPQEVASFKSCSTQDDLARLFGTSLQNLLFHLYSKQRPRYRTLTIPKKSGDARTISIPPRTILQWQRELLRYLAALYEPKVATQGFVASRGIKSNARKHIGRELVLCIDLQDFFPSIHFGRIQGLFRRPPFDFFPTVAATLAHLCTNEAKLPQGAATSPVLSNLICRRLDNDLHRLALKSKSTYTRFCDDITFSTHAAAFKETIVSADSSYDKTVVLGVALLGIFEKHKFKVNERKTRILKNAKRQRITGVIVNEKVNIPREHVRNLRALIYNWQKDGLQSVTSDFVAIDATTKTRRKGPPLLKSHLRGKLEFMRMIRGRGDALHARYAIAASKLPGYDRSLLLEGAASRIHGFVSEAVWVVVGFDAENYAMTNGTAFELQGVGFVTARHIFEESDGIVAWRLIRGCEPWEEVAVTSYRADDNLDMAILGTSARSHAILRRTKREKMIHGDSVTILGFPSWNTYGDKPLQVDSNIVQIRPIRGSRLASVQYPLLSGASGGPVLDKAGHVLAIIVTTRDHAVVPNGILDISHIDAVRTAEERQL